MTDKKETLWEEKGSDIQGVEFYRVIPPKGAEPFHARSKPLHYTGIRLPFPPPPLQHYPTHPSFKAANQSPSAPQATPSTSPTQTSASCPLPLPLPLPLPSSYHNPPPPPPLSPPAPPSICQPAMPFPDPDRRLALRCAFRAA